MVSRVRSLICWSSRLGRRGIEGELYTTAHHGCCAERFPEVYLIRLSKGSLRLRYAQQDFLFFFILTSPMHASGIIPNGASAG